MTVYIWTFNPNDNQKLQTSSVIFSKSTFIYAFNGSLALGGFSLGRSISWNRKKTKNYLVELNWNRRRLSTRRHHGEATKEIKLLHEMKNVSAIMASRKVLHSFRVRWQRFGESVLPHRCRQPLLPREEAGREYLFYFIFCGLLLGSVRLKHWSICCSWANNYNWMFWHRLDNTIEMWWACRIKNNTVWQKKMRKQSSNFRSWK